MLYNFLPNGEVHIYEAPTKEDHKVNGLIQYDDEFEDRSNKEYSDDPIKEPCWWTYSRTDRGMVFCEDLQLEIPNEIRTKLLLLRD